MTTLHSTTDLQRMTLPELRKEVSTLRAEAARVRLAIEMQGEKNHAQYRTLRRGVARMLTVITMKEKGDKGAQTEAPSASKVSARKTSQTKKKPVQDSSAS